MAIQTQDPVFAGGFSLLSQEDAEEIFSELPYFAQYFTREYMQERLQYLLAVNKEDVRQMMLEEFKAVYGGLMHSPSTSRDVFISNVGDRVQGSHLIDPEFEVQFAKLIRFDHDPLDKKQTSFISVLSNITSQFQIENKDIIGSTDFYALYELALILVLPPSQRDLFLRRYLCKCAYDLKWEPGTLKLKYIYLAPKVVSDFAKYIAERLPLKQTLEM